MFLINGAVTKNAKIHEDPWEEVRFQEVDSYRSDESRYSYFGVSLSIHRSYELQAGHV